MKSLKVVMLCFGVLVMTSLMIPMKAFADKSAVEIEVPAKATMGEEIDIVLHVSHDGNSFIHYTNLVTLHINGKQVNKWEFSMFNRPEAEKFLVSFSYPAEKNLEVKAEAFCNLHGSKNVAEKTVSVDAVYLNE